MSLIDKRSQQKKVSEFSDYAAVKTLKDLALHPFDLTKEGNLTSERLNEFVAEGCGYRLLYGTERITAEVIDALNALATESKAIHKMESMQAGEILNYIDGFPSEKRAVLHTATRDFFEQSNTGKAAVEAAELAKKEVAKLESFIKKIDRDNAFTDLVCIGIGGSDLGPRAHFIALQHLLKKGRQVHFISNVDPDDTAMALRGLNLAKTLVLVISKTGTTLETLSNEEFVKAQFASAGLNPAKHFIAITSQGSPMDDRSKYLEAFYMWDWIGGRYSTTSMVGGVMLAFAFGSEVYWEFLRGASAMDKLALNPDIDRNLPLLGALLEIWNRNFLGYPTLALIPYSQALARYSAHIQQVEMESNGKRIDQQGIPCDFQTAPVIWGEPGTNAQHSFYQLIHQGTAIIPLEFIGFQQSQCQQDNEFKGTTLQQKLLANLFAQALALALGQPNDNPNKQFLGNRPSHILLAKQLTPASLGSLLAYFEHKVAFEGFIWGINSFDQEGVQLGKELAQKIIDRFADRKGQGRNQSYPLGDALIGQLELC